MLSSSSTFVDVVRSQLQRCPDLEAYLFLADGEREGDRLTLEELDRKARQIAAQLQGDGGEVGDRALLLYPPGLDFITAFVGCLYAGVVAIPTYPPRFNRPQPRLQAILDDSDPRWVLTTESIAARREKLQKHTPELAERPFLITDGSEEVEGLETRWQQPEIDGDSLAFLQYTSGSTSTPKGVMVRHRNLVHNEAMIQSAFDQDRESVVVSWLPLYHDMGLIGGVLQPLFLGARCVLMAPHAFLQKPIRWLEAIARYGATTSGGPDFAYALCVRRTSPEDRARLDLSSWRVAFNGAEPVRAETLEAFAEAFAGSGFDRQAFYPCYGLAEATLFVTGGGVERVPVSETFDPNTLLEHRPKAAATGRTLVSSGHSWLEQRLEVVDPDSRHPLAPYEVGEIWVSGPSVAGGYWQRPEQTAEDFGARLATDDSAGPFLRTGDLGFVDTEGELFVTGRSKDLIIIRGQNHYPQDLELTAERAHPALRPGGGAAFALATPEGEQLVLVQEVERRREAEAAEALDALRRTVAERHEVAVHDVVAIRAGTLPKTTSGKVQRRATRGAYLAEALTVVARASLVNRPAVASSDTGTDTLVAVGSEAQVDRVMLLALDATARQVALLSFLRHQVAGSLRTSAEAIEPGLPLTQLGLDSLAAVELQHSIESRCGVEVDLAELLAGSSLVELAERIAAQLEAGSTLAGPRLEAAPLKREHPLSQGQRALWFLHQLDPGSAAYNIAVAVAMDWRLDVDALEAALEAVVARHPALRATFHEVDGEPLHRIEAEPRVEVVRHDAEGLSEDELTRALEAVAIRPFDLERGPLLRFEVFRRGVADHVVAMVVHHTVADFWSMATVARELGVFYRRECGGTEEIPPRPTLSYGDYVRWQQEMLASPRGDELWSYWRQRLDGAPPRLELPTDRPRPAVQSFRGTSRTRVLDPELGGRVAALAARSGMTVYTVLLAAFQALLQRTSGQDDLVVGSPTAGRGHAELSGVVGYFVNPVALRLDLAGEPSGEELLVRTRETVLGAFEHHEFPFPLLAERLHPERHPSISPIFQTFFVYQGAPRPEEQDLAALTVGAHGVSMGMGGLRFTTRPITEQVAQFDLSLVVAQVGGRLRTLVEYSTDLFDGSTIGRFLDHYATLLAGLVETPERRLSELPWLTRAETTQILGEWAGVARPTPEDTLHRAILAGLDERSGEQAQTLAVQGEVAADELEDLSYAELATQSARLARRLRDLGVGPEVPVAVLLPRSIDTVVAMLAVLRAGGCYLPLDPQAPAARSSFQLADAQAAVLLTLESRRDELTAELEVPGGTKVLTVEDAIGDVAEATTDGYGAVPGEAEVRGDHPAYLIYTSGSTGRPKGVAVGHRQALEHCRVVAGRLALTPEDRVLFFGSPSFDPAVEQVFCTLLAGARLVLRGASLWAPERFPVRADALGLTVADLPVGYWQEVVREAPQAPKVETLRQVVVGGDVMPPATALAHHDSALGPAALWNIYGPTEAVISATLHTTTPADASLSRIPIGPPLEHRQVYVLDRSGRPVAAGVVGELHLGGLLARGYLGRPALTAERFVPHPFSERPGERLYRTGDLVRFLADGAIDFLGRRDHQVKLRGFRIELGEIEVALEAHPEVATAVVVRVESPGQGGDLLAAFVEPVPGVLDEDPETEGRLSDRLRGALAKSLPDYMQPAAIKVLQSLPLNAAGKVDRQALPVAEVVLETPERAYVAPRSPVEGALAKIWAELLGVERVGVHASFFALGGHSLLATKAMSRVRQTFGVELPLQTLFELPSVADFARRLEAVHHAGREVLPPLVPQPRDERPPASFAQERLWFLDQLQPGSPFYNIPAAFRLRGPLSEPVLARSLAEITRRHEALRTRFAALDGRPCLVIDSASAPPVPVVDLGHLRDGEREATLSELARREARLPFDLETGPLWRVTLVRLAADDRVMLLTMHHIISDGWSLGVFVRELERLYGAFVAHQSSPLEALPIQFADYALWQRQWLCGELLDRQLDYWTEQLQGAPPILELPADRPRPPVQSFRGSSLRFRLSAPTRDRLTELAKEEDGTLFMAGLSIFLTLLGRLTGSHDVVVGSPISNRDRLEVEGLVGFFVNALVLRQDLSGEPTFRQLVGRVRQTALGAYAHPDVPFERLVQKLHPERDLGHTPIFQVVFALESAAFETVRLPSVDLEPMPLETGTAKFDLTLLFDAVEQGLEGYLEYSTDLFDDSTAARFAEHYRALVHAALDTPDVPVSQLSMLTESEREMLRVEWTATASDYPRDRRVDQLFAEQARIHGDAVALESVASGETLTYRQLDEEANRLAHLLVAEGVGPEVPVGLCFERSNELMVAIVAVLKAGGLFVPLDPDYPAERLAFMLEDLGETLLVGRGEPLARLAVGDASRRLDLDTLGGKLAAASVEAPEVEGDPSQLAYVMYTSGSTGRPKGVAVDHRAIIRLVRETGFAHFGPDETFLQFAPVAFDASTLEIWGPLLNGGRLVVMPPGQPSLEDLGGVLERYGVTTLWLTAGLFHQMVELHVEQLRPLRQLLAGGDTLSVPHVQKVLRELPGIRMINGYGPTENTTFTCCHPMTHPSDVGATVSIGRPIANTTVFIVDPQGDLAPIGVPGELLVAGDGLSRCYQSRPALTAERFVPHPFAETPGERVYRTGDLSRWLGSGNVEFLGRIDQQVKIRGYRIELEEIEAVLSVHPAIHACAAVARPAAGDKQLVACVVPAAGHAMPSSGDLRDYLLDHLPRYMVPSVFEVLEELPLAPTGKVDRRALAAAPTTTKTLEKSDQTAPRSPTEELLCELWGELLERPQPIGVYEDFFEIGGHSLLATQLVSRVRERFGVDLPLQEVFERPTVAGLAQHIEGTHHRNDDLAKAPVAAIERVEPHAPLSFSQERLWFLDQLEGANAAYNIVAALRLRGDLDPGALAWALGQVVARHDVLRTTFHGAAADAPHQRWSEHAEHSLPVLDLSMLPAARRQPELVRQVRAEAGRVFDLGRGPLFRSLLIHLGVRDDVLVLNLHHIIGDGWSVGVLSREISTLYAGRVSGSETALEPLAIQYSDYSEWQRHTLEEVFAEDLSYWREQLADAPTGLDLPTDRPRPARQSFRGAQLALTLDGELLEGLRHLAKSNDCTPYMVLLAVYDVVLGRFSGAHELLVGSPVANRQRIETEGLIGFFVNTLVLRQDLSGAPTFRQLMARVRDTTLAAYARQTVPFERVVAEVDPERQLGHNPLFQVMLAYQNEALVPPTLGDLEVELLDVDAPTAKFDLTWSLSEEHHGLAGFLEYNVDLFDRSTVERLAGSLRHLLTEAIAQPDTAITQLPLLDAAQRHQLASEWGTVAPAVRPGRCLHHLVAEQALRTPDAVALRGRDEVLTYEQLVRRVVPLAVYLSELGVGPEVRVGVMLERDPELLISLLAVLVAGGTYVGLDPNYPDDRLAFMVADSAAHRVVTRGSLAATLGSLAATLGDDAPMVDLDTLELATMVPTTGTDLEALAEVITSSPADPANLAYLIYTSGSTGRPKGVAIAHRSAVERVFWARRKYSDRELSGVLAGTSVCFDLSIYELFVPLAWGGTVILARDVLELASHPAADAVRLINTVPSALSELLRSGAVPDGVVTVNLAGEPFQQLLVEQLFADTQVEALYNLYGPSEDTTYSTGARILPGASRPPAIGRPLDGTVAQVLDSVGEPVPVGVAGELLLGGDGLARGYLGRPALTAASFVPDPLSGEPGARRYRTGDRVRFRADGDLDFLGRFDHQVKVRGFRIELGEIEARLLDHPAIHEAVVAVRGDGADARLVAWAASGIEDGRKVGQDVLKDFLGEKLPDYMVPTHLLLLDELPRLPNGKVARKELPEPSATGSTSSGAPRSPLEEVVAEAFASILGSGPVGIHDDFVALGGHSLLATRVVSSLRATLGIELPLRALFEAPTVARLAARLAAERDDHAASAPPIEAGERPDRLPLSFSQQRQWLLDQLEPGDPAYNIPAAYTLDGPVDVAALEAALGVVVDRHESLRTVFAHHEGTPYQVIHPRLEVALPRVDLRALPGAERARELRRRLLAEADFSFDLAHGPLLRLVLLQLDGERHVVALNLHHIVADGWSMGIFVRELAQAYDALAGGSRPELPALPVQYPDVAVWQRRWLEGEALERGLDYWRKQLADAPGQLDLPTDRPRPAVRRSAGGQTLRRLPEELVEGLRAVARSQGGTLYMVLLGVLDVLLWRLTGQRDLSVGSYIANRQRGETEGLIGFFVNTLVLRAQLEPKEPFSELVGRLREVTLDAYAHQEIPFEKVLDAVQPVRDPSVTPLFQVMAVLQNTPGEAPRLGGTELREVAPEERPVHYDLTFWMTEEEGGLLLNCQFALALFDVATIDRMLDRFVQLAHAVVADPDCRVDRLQVLDPAKRHQLLDEWSGRLVRLAEIETRRGSQAALQPVHRQILDRAHTVPERIALRFEGTTTSYAELAERVQQRARRLLALGAGPEVPVAICLDRSPELVVSLLAVLEAGSYYLPLDPKFPAERMAFMVADSGASILIAETHGPDALPEVEHVLWVDAGTDVYDGPEAPWGDGALGDEEVEPLPCDEESLAYAIYTSGSTGKPKGTLIPHRALAHFVDAARRVYGIDSEDRVLQFASVSFDASVEEIFPVLTQGGTLVLRPEAVETPMALLERCRRDGVTVLDLPTAYWHTLCRWLELGDGALPPQVRLVILGGEAVQRPHLESWWRLVGRDVRLANSYGPTEATVVATLSELSSWHPASSTARIAIGRPLPGVEMLVLSRDLQPVPQGAAGELVLGGDSLARGYLGRGATTAEVFVPHPWASGERLYRTGDLVRFRADGELEFLGRIDRQVKVRGFRVELRGVEAALLECPGVDESAVVVQREPTGEQRLVAYVAGKGEPLTVPGLRAALRRHLPDYMVPALFEVLDALPKTSSGKIDRRALPEPSSEELVVDGVVAPRDENEALLARLWAEVLGRSQVGIHDNFFELGGDSILGIQIISRAHQEGLQLTPQQLFQHQTIAELAAVAESGPAVEAEQGVVTGEAPLTPYQAWFFDDLRPDDPEHWNIALMLELRRPWPAPVLAGALDDLLAHHDGLRMRFEPDAEGRWVQRTAGLGDPVPFTAIDLSALPAARRTAELEHQAEVAQASLDLARGPMLRAVLFPMGDEAPRLLLALHHMVVDVISWHVILDDLQTACEGRLEREQVGREHGEGQRRALPPKTTSYRQWSERLAEHARSPEMETEAEYWLRPQPRDLAVFTADDPLGENLEGSTEAEFTILDEDETRELLQEVPKTYNTQVNDALLAALLTAMTRHCGGSALRIDLEGHGREDILEGVDLSRTVGCFTALFPVVLELPETEGPGEVLKAVKETLRAIPRHGVGYGVLRYLGDDPARTEALRDIPPAEASFNYVGQFDQVLPASSPFALASEATGAIRSPRAARGNTLEILGGVSDGKLHVRWIYSRNLHRRESVEALAKAFATALRELIEHCKDPEAASFTPSDFELAGLSQNDLDTILGEIEGFE